MVCCPKKTPIKGIELEAIEEGNPLQDSVEKEEEERNAGGCCSCIKCKLPSCSISKIFSALSYVALIKALVSLGSYLYDLASKYNILMRLSS